MDCPIVPVQVLLKVHRLPGSLEGWESTLQEDVVAPLRRAQDQWGQTGRRRVPYKQVCTVFCRGTMRGVGVGGHSCAIKVHFARQNPLGTVHTTVPERFTPPRGGGTEGMTVKRVSCSTTRPMQQSF